MSKKFEYELMLRLEKAEKAIASLASKIEKDLGKAVETAFRGASEFDVVKFSKNIGSRIEQDVSSALKQAFSGSSEFDFSRRVASSVEQDVKAALQSAFSGSSQFDFADPNKAKQAEEEASRKRIQQIKDSSETKNRLAEQDHQRELQRIEGEDAARKKADADALKRIQDQQAAEAARDADVYQRRQAEANIAASEKKAHDDKQEMYEKLWGAEKNAHTDRIAQIRANTAADKAAQEIRYKDHTTVLNTIKEAHVMNASDLAAIEQRITTMTEAEAKQQLDAYRKTAKARVDYAIEAGYQLEADNARQSANGARSVSAIFQVQQAIEDSMYAGLRGAGNNIAMLLTSISSGWLAIGGLIGVATLQLASHLGVFEKLNEAMDGALWKTKEQVRLEEYLFRLRKEEFDRDTKQQIDAANFDPASKTVDQAKKDVENERRKLEVERDRESRLRVAVELFKELQAVEAPRETRTFQDLKALEEREAAARKLREQIRELGISFNADGKDAGSLTKELEAIQKAMEDLGSGAAATESKLKLLEDQLKKVIEVDGRKKEQESVRDQAMKIVEDKIEAAKLLVKTREDELQTIQKALEAAQRSLEVEERRADAIRKAASARADEAAKQELGLKNTILDMEADEKAKIAKDKAGSAEDKVKSQLAWAKQWAEQQAKIDKSNNPKNGANIAAAKDWWINNQEQQAQAELDRIKKTEQAEIEAAKKVAEEAKKANLDAMETIQRQKAEQLKADAQQLLGQGKFGDAQDALDKAQKTLKEIADAEVSNLGQKDSVQQGKDALREWQSLQQQIKEVEDQKLAISEKAQEAEKQNILREMAKEDQAAARLATAKTELERTLNVKEQIKATPLIDPNDLESVRKFREEMERILGLRLQIGGGGMGPMPAPGMGGQGQPAGGPAGPGGGSGFPTGPALPGNSGFSLTFNMNNATPNSVAAAANSIVQSQKAMAMLSGV